MKVPNEWLDRVFTMPWKQGSSTLAPRIKALRCRIDVLEANRSELRQRQQEPEVELLSLAEIKRHVVDLKSFLCSESVLKKNTFLRTFIKQIDVDLPQVAIDFTLPIWP